THFFNFAVGIGDDPVPAKQARRHLADIADANRVGEHEALAFGLRLVVEEARGNGDLDAIGNGFHGLDCGHSGGPLQVSWLCARRLARRMKSATASCSARVPGSMSADSMKAASHSPESALRRVLRRCPKASRTTRANIVRSTIPMLAGLRGTSRTTAESTLGGGLNAPGATLNRPVTSQLACNITLSRP